MGTSVDAVSIIVVTHNSAARLARYLRPVMDQFEAAGIPAELILVDSASADGTVARARELFPASRVLRQPTNVGFSAGCNIGARAAETNWIWLLNDDIVATSEALTNVWQRRRSDAVVMPLIRGVDGHLQNVTALRWERLALRVTHGTRPEAFAAFPLGCCFLLSRDLYLDVGGMDERLSPAYLEDTALGVRLWARQAVVEIVTDSEVIHENYGGDDLRRRAAERLVYRNRWIFAFTLLRGWRRWATVGVAPLRVVLESVRRRDLGPLVGFLEFVARVPGLRSRRAERVLDGELLRKLSEPTSHGVPSTRPPVRP